MQAKIQNMRAVDFKNVKAFFTIELTDLGMSINDCKLVSRNDGNGFFIGWPSAKQPDGTYKNMIFLNKDSKKAEEFQEDIIKKVVDKL